jgi:phosphohistidine phosphatase SixA
MSNFVSGNYAVMRHAKDGREGILDHSKEVCRRVVSELAEKLIGQTVVICHSPLNRAVWTAEIVRQELVSRDVPVERFEALDWLSSDTRGLSNEQISTVLPENGEVFILFITHQPDIEHYLRDDTKVTNCSVFSRDFTIKGH